MQNLSIRSADGLYWIGRYLQRFEIVAKEAIKVFDHVIDIDKHAGEKFFAKLGRSVEYKNATDFFIQTVYGVSSANLYYLMNEARENATVLRDILDDDAFMIINVIHTELGMQKQTVSPKFIEGLVRKLDSFWGRIFLKTQHGIVQMLVEFGQTVEAIDLKLRLFDDLDAVRFDVEKLNTLGRAINPSFTEISIQGQNAGGLLLGVNRAIGEIIRYEY